MSRQLTTIERQDAALWAARMILANEVRDKTVEIGKDLGKNADEFTAPESPGFVSSDNVVEILEEMIEGGDHVIDDPAIHRWFRDKLTKHRELEMKIDAVEPSDEFFNALINKAVGL